MQTEEAIFKELSKMTLMLDFTSIRVLSEENVKNGRAESRIRGLMILGENVGCDKDFFI